ncbi:MAG TPA: ribonuclease J, partial [Dehalococcoidales bacterium]|nr:ribonuclease J [Dehalococcoidales bacterium]
VDTRESREMIEGSRDLVARVLGHGGTRSVDWGFIYSKVRDTLSKFYYEKTKQRPMVLPFMVKV